MTTILPGAEPMSAAGNHVGVLTIHGFTGSPQSMRPIAAAMADAPPAPAPSTARTLPEMEREALVKAALTEWKEQVHTIPLHRQVIPWAARSNVTVVHRADNYVTVEWISVNK